ncbi:MAG: serine hydrolase [Candidatus Saccharibacteria bacterium]|nr:serine hydrolase [Candidatus Saccharibacteria bacterium]
MLDYKKITGYIIAGVAGFAVLIAGIFGVYKLISENSKKSAEEAEQAEIQAQIEASTPEQINIQLPLNQWLDGRADRDRIGVVIYDVDNDAIVGRHNEDQVFDMAQLYQLFVAYQAYIKIERHDWKSSELVGSTNLTRALCLDYTLRWSDVACSDAIWDSIGRDILQKEFQDMGYEKTTFANFTSTPTEISNLMRLYHNHPNFTEETWNMIQDSLLNQRDNQTFDKQDLRQGLPSGFTSAKVYNKSGWYKTTAPAVEGNNPSNATIANGIMNLWHTYDDAAIVEFPEVVNNDGETKPARHYIFAVLTNETSPQEIVLLGRTVETFVKTADRY